MSIDLQNTHQATKEKLLLILEDYGKRAYFFSHELVEPYVDKENQRLSTFESSEELARCWARLELALWGLQIGFSMIENQIEPFTTVEDRIVGWMADFHGAAAELIKVFEKRVGNVEPNIERDNAIRAQLAKLRGGEVEPRVEPNFAPDKIKDREQVKKIRVELRLLGDGRELRHLRESRLTAVEEAQKEVAFIRSENPFGLPEGAEDFDVRSILGTAQQNGYSGHLRQLRQHLATWKGDERAPGEKWLLSRAELEEFLRYLSQKQRAKP